MKIGIALAAYQPSLEIFVPQLESIQTQTHTDWICILTFDSPMKEVIQNPILQSFRDDTRFIWIENSARLGHKKNFEKAMQETLKYEVDAIACSDQDDIWYKHKLAVCAAKLKTCPPLSLVHSDMHIMDKQGHLAPQTAWTLEKRGTQNVKPRHFYIRNIVAGCSMLLDAELARRYPIIPDGALFHDWWYALVASYQGGVYGIAEPLYAYRQHGENEVGITPYQAIFATPPGSTLNTLLQKCQKGWNRSHRLAQGAKIAKLPFTVLDTWIFLLPYDLGLGFFILALFNWISDPALTRACLARAIGKITTPSLSKN